MSFFKKTWVQVALGAFVLVYLYRRFAPSRASVTPLPFAGKYLTDPAQLAGGAFGSLQRIDNPAPAVQDLVAPKTGAYS